MKSLGLEFFLCWTKWLYNCYVIVDFLLLAASLFCTADFFITGLSYEWVFDSGV